MSDMLKLERHLAAEEARAERTRSRVKKARRLLPVRCNHCGVHTPVGEMEYIQTLWYVKPYSCTGGDYWSEGEGCFACPACGYENRLFARPHVVKLKCYFKKVVQRHDEESDSFLVPDRRKWVN